MRGIKSSGRQQRVQRASQPYASAGKRLYVGNLSYEVAWQDLKDHFKTVGQVVRADVMQDASGRSKGCGIVEFASAGDAAEAIRTLNDTELKGRLIFVREDRENGSGGAPVSGDRFAKQTSAAAPAAVVSHGPTGVIVENLPADYDWRNLKDSFRVSGSVVRADIVINSSTGAVGVVDFQTTQEAQQAVSQFNGAVIDNRVLSVRLRGSEASSSSHDNNKHPVVMSDRHNSNHNNSNNNNAVATSGKLYVGQLAWSVNWQRLKDHFKQCGDVLRADVITEHNNNNSTGRQRSKGYGFVEYATVEEAQRAIDELNNSELEGRKIFVRENRE